MLSTHHYLQYSILFTELHIKYYVFNGHLIVLPLPTKRVSLAKRSLLSVGLGPIKDIRPVYQSIVVTLDLSYICVMIYVCHYV